ncbi:MAG: ABC transporter substrate-binding protein [Clostridiales Family XIII bacterium]|jgi:polar amino acid transport system substrate-binding protein|nr:ABC transporter substrate-binding protein [Clostridiales Family XIII bacterium]
MKAVFKHFAPALLAFLLIAALAACGGKDEAADGAAANEGAEAGDAAATEGAETESGLATLTPGKLTIATGNPAWAPWVLDDDPESGRGFEAAVAYAVAEELGFAKEDVVWVRTDFDEAIQPGPKDFDFNLQQYSITEARRDVVDFSSPYYREPLVVIAKADNPFAGATSVAELKGALFGAASGDVAVQYTTDGIAPDQDVRVFNNLSDVLAALNNGQVDAAIVSMLTGDYIINIEGEQVENGTIIGKLPGSENATEGLGLLLPKDSPLTEAVSKAVDTLKENGTLDALAGEWLSQFDIQELQ